MSATNPFDMDKTPNLPSADYLYSKRIAAHRRLVREILMKEYQFRSCRLLESDIEKRMYEKELGELYAELMKPFKDAINILQL